MEEEKASKVFGSHQSCCWGALARCRGVPQYWLNVPPMQVNITTINRYLPEAVPGIETLIGDGCHLPFEDQSFDIVFSNSVIEHVGSWENQKLFAKEILRVGKKVWVQTPARECPIEPHYLAPFVHYMSPRWQKRWLRHLTPWGWMEKPDQNAVDQMVETTRLLTRREMEELFPRCQIIEEKLLGFLPKSHVVLRP